MDPAAETVTHLDPSAAAVPHPTLHGSGGGGGRSTDGGQLQADPPSSTAGTAAAPMTVGADDATPTAGRQWERTAYLYFVIFFLDFYFCMRPHNITRMRK